jgi:hypothetical protein
MKSFPGGDFMKYAKSILVVLMFLVPLFVPLSVAAQISASDRIVAQVPFTFVVANKVVPVGQCILERADPTGNVFVIRNPDAKVSLFVGSAPRKGAKAAGAYSLIFHRYGNRYYLTALRLEGSSTVYLFRASRFEEEALAKNTAPTEEVVLASRR